MTDAASLDLPGLGDGKVLIVEDNRFNRDLVAGVLQMAGIGEIAFAVNGAEGLAMVESFEPDLVILDLMMPVMDGHEFLRRLKQDPAHLDLPVLITTAISEQQTRNAAFDGGAVDYIEKPIDRRELVARVAVHLKSRLLLGRLQRYHDRLELDLATARSMQEALLPSPRRIAEVKARYGLTVNSLFVPSAELGGDLWGLVPIDDRHVAAFAADFTGHGVAASINTFRLHVLIDRLGIGTDPAAFLGRLNAELLPILTRGHFATMVVAIFDRTDGSVAVASAGGPTPILGGGGRGLRRLPLDAPALGITPTATYISHRVAFPPSSFLLLYSDAMIETCDPAGTQLGESGLDRLVEDALASTEPPLDHLAGAIDSYGQGQIVDDLTAVWLSW